MSRFVIDVDVLLHLLGGELDVSAEHQLLAPTLVRSQALSQLYSAVRRGEMSKEQALERLDRLGRLGIRFLGDGVLRRVAWEMAESLGWDSTFDAEYLALTKLQADALVTADEELAHAASGLVETATIDALR